MNFSGELTEKFYQRVQQIPVGEILTFDQLGEIGLNGHGRRLIYAANKKLLKHHNKMLINQRMIGYKMAEPKEQMEHAWKRKTFARRQVTNAVIETVHIDTSKLTADERQVLTDRELYLKQQLRGLRMRNIAAQKVAKDAAIKIERSVEIQNESLKELDRLISESEELRKRLLG